MGQLIGQKMGPGDTKPQFTCLTELFGSRQWLRSLLMKWSSFITYWQNNKPRYMMLSIRTTWSRLLTGYSVRVGRGGICGKFNLSNCCLQIDDKGKVIEEITRKMTKIAHVPVQTWKGWNPGELLEG